MATERLAPATELDYQITFTNTRRRASSHVL
jgi:hypothetical protein